MVMARPVKDADADQPIRQLRTLRWGLVPSWAKEPSIGNRMINARAESIDTKPAFRRAFSSRRAIVPVDGFYEWFPTQQLGRNGKPVKQPFYIHRSDGEMLAFAGIYEFWRNPDRAKSDPDAWLTTFSIITTTASSDVEHLHDRMPMSVMSKHWDQWLDPHVNDADTVRGLMAPPRPGTLDIHPVARTVNNVRNDGPNLIVPLRPTA